MFFKVLLTKLGFRKIKSGDIIEVTTNDMIYLFQAIGETFENRNGKRVAVLYEKGHMIDDETMRENNIDPKYKGRKYTLVRIEDITDVR